MKININRISPCGLLIEEELSGAKLEIETEIIKFPEPIRVKADIYKITDTVTVDVVLIGTLHAVCSRCLEEVKIDLNKKLKLSYQAGNFDKGIDIGPDIREEIIMDYPMKPVCKPDCKGLCQKCGENLNKGKCSCNLIKEE